MLGKPRVIVIHVQFVPDFGTPESVTANVLAYLLFYLFLLFSWEVHWISDTTIAAILKIYI